MPCENIVMDPKEGKSRKDCSGNLSVSALHIMQGNVLGRAGFFW